MKYHSNKPGITDKDAKVIGVFIKDKFGGNVTPKEFLEAARPLNSPVHDYFDWNDSSAAEKYRLEQARNLIISVYVVADDNNPIREFLRVQIGQQKRYLEHEQVEQNQDLMDQVIAGAKEQLVRWQERYGRYMDYFNFKFIAKGKEHVIEKEEGRRKKPDNSRYPNRKRKTDDRGNKSAHGQQV